MASRLPATILALASGFHPRSYPYRSREYASLA